jgi:hypothetical protein
MSRKLPFSVINFIAFGLLNLTYRASSVPFLALEERVPELVEAIKIVELEALAALHRRAADGRLELRDVLDQECGECVGVCAQAWPKCGELGGPPITKLICPEAVRSRKNSG